MTRIVALTGGIGSGKSTVAAMLARLGARVIDADAIVHELQQPGSPALDEIVEAFGAGMLRPSGELDREALGDLVFRDPEARARLGRILHPKVGVEMARRVSEAIQEGVELVVLDIPLLFEGRRAGTGSSRLMEFDATVLVYVPEETQVERQLGRESYGRDEALRRIRAQLPLDEKRALADHVIDNAGSLEETERQVRAVYEAITGAPAPRTAAAP